MSFTRVDYSEMVYALKEGDKVKADSLLKELSFRLKDYLQVVLGANKEDAEECSQEALLIVYEQIMQDNINDEKRIFSYLLTVCRNEYFSMRKNRWAKDTDPMGDPSNYEHHLVGPAEQVEKLQDEERQKILEACLNKLSEEARTFIEYLLEKPKTTTKEASKYFDMSEANVRTTKSRILSRLHHCFQRKWNK